MDKLTEALIEQSKELIEQVKSEIAISDKEVIVHQESVTEAQHMLDQIKPVRPGSPATL